MDLFHLSMTVCVMTCLKKLKHLISLDENSFAGLCGLPLYGNPNIYHCFKSFSVLIFFPLIWCLPMLGNRHDPNAIITALKELMCSINTLLLTIRLMYPTHARWGDYSIWSKKLGSSASHHLKLFKYIFFE